MTIEQIRARLKEIVAQQQKILESCGSRELSSDEEANFGELDQEFGALKTKLEKLERARCNATALTGGIGRITRAPDPQTPIDGNQWSGIPGSDRWIDADGNRIVCLPSSQSLREYQREQGFFAEQEITQTAEDLGVGLRGLITGQWPEGSEHISSALSTGQDAQGGFWLTPLMSATLIDLARNRSVIMAAGAMTIPMPSQQLVMVRVTADPNVSWTGENQVIPETQPMFGRLTFRARKLAARVPLSVELAQDAPNAAEQIRDQLATVLAIEIDRAALLGNAENGEPIGLFNAVGTQEIPVGGAPDYDSFLDALEKVENVNGEAGAYIMSPKTKNTLAKIKDNQGAYLTPPPDLQSLARLTTKQLADSQAALGDFEQVMLGVLGSLQIEISRDGAEAWEKDQIEIKIRWRGDVQFARPSHLIKLTGIA
ncbi:MAG: phage major capsid protein [Pseudomonadota bacterium]